MRKFVVTQSSEREAVAEEAWNAINDVADSMEPNEDGSRGPINVQVSGNTDDGTITIEVPEPLRVWELTFFLKTRLPEDQVEEFAGEVVDDADLHLTEGEDFHFGGLQ
jgi:hypothetical protein